MKSNYSLLFMLVLLFAACNTTQKVTSATSSAVKAPEEIIPTTPKMITSVEGITEYELGNGMRVLMFPDQSKPTITVNVTYLVGSRHEGYGETGMAHLLEHLVFKGTPKHPNIPDELTSHGASPNGTTWYDRTNYFETFNATEENLDWALDLEADRMVNSYIAKKDLDSEMTVVRNEYERGENDPGGVLYKRVLSSAFSWHNYGNVTIGARSDLENVPIDRLKAFYKKYYQPDNAVLLVAGKFEPESTLKKINNTFGKIPPPNREENLLYDTYTKEPTQDGEKSVTLRRVGDVQALVTVFHTPPGPHPDYAAIAVLDEVMTNEPSGRLYKSMVETKKAAYQWGFAPGLREGGYVVFGAEVRKDGDVMDAQAAMLKTIEEVVTNPPTQEEVDRAKAKILKNWDMSFNNANRVGIFLSNYIAMGDWRLLFKFRDRIEEVAAGDVLNVAKKYFIKSNRTTGVFIPEEDPVRADIPNTPDIAQMLEGYTGKGEIAVGEEFDPSHENIEKRTSKSVNAAGPDYAFLSKETRGDNVIAQIRLRYGDEQSLMNKSTAADMMAEMLNKGTKTMTRQEIQDKFDQLKANVRIDGGVTGLSARIQTERKNLSEVVDMVMDIFKNPSFDAAEFEKVKEENLAYYESQKSEPNTLANRALSRMMEPYPKGHPKYTSTLDEDIAAIKALNIKEVKQFYNDFVGASDATVSVVGDFDQSAIEAKIKAGLDDWKSPKPYKRIADKYFESKPGDKKIETPDKANSIFFAGQNIPMKDDHPDYAAMVLGNFMLGGGFLNSRLATRIRQKEGLSYGVGSWFNAGSEDESAMFGSYAIYAPENLEKLEIAYKEEIQKVLDSGFTDEEITAAKSGWLQRQVVRRAEDGRLVGSLNSNLYLNRDMMWSKALEEKINTLTAEQIHNAMKKHIDLSKFTFVKAGDFEGAAKKNAKP